MPLIINRNSPGWVRRARNVIWQEFRMDLMDFPDADWVAILCVACDHEKADTFRAAVIAETQRMADKRHADADRE